MKARKIYRAFLLVFLIAAIWLQTAGALGEAFWGLELILSTITPENQKEFLAKTIAPLNEQELHLLEVYFSEEMSLAATSERLFLHKNTLQYKLNAIQKKCSLNPRKFQDAVLLYLAGKIK